MATVQSLLLAGADADADNNANDETPIELAVDGSSCRDLLEHHATVQAVIRADPIALVSAALSYCATLADSKEAVPASQLSLHAYQLDPFFLWAPSAARTAVLAWARNAFVIQLAAMTEPFDELPDDCSIEVIEYLETNLARSESLCLAKHCSSPEAHAWVRSIVAAAVVVSLFVSCPKEQVKHLVVVLDSFCLIDNSKSYALCCISVRRVQQRSCYLRLEMAT